MFYNINNIDDFWSRVQTAAVNFNVFPSLVDGLPDFRRYPDDSVQHPLSLLLWLPFVLHTVRPSRSSGEKKRFISVMKIATLKITGVFVVDAHPVSEIGCCSVIFVVQLKRNKPNCYAALPSLNTGRSYSQMKMVPGIRDR